MKVKEWSSCLDWKRQQTRNTQTGLFFCISMPLIESLNMISCWRKAFVEPKCKLQFVVIRFERMDSSGNKHPFAKGINSSESASVGKLRSSECLTALQVTENFLHITLTLFSPSKGYFLLFDHKWQTFRAKQLNHFFLFSLINSNMSGLFFCSRANQVKCLDQCV